MALEHLSARADTRWEVNEAVPSHSAHRIAIYRELACEANFAVEPKYL
jgi:hypothetical protein